MAEFLQIPYGDVIIAALVPAFLYYVALFIQVDLEAARYNIKAAIDIVKIPFIEIMCQGWHYLGAFAVIIVSLFVFNFSPSASAIFGAISVILTGTVSGYRGKRLTPLLIWQASKETGIMMLEIIMIAAAAGIIIGILNVTGFGFALTLMLSKLGAGNLFLMLLVAAGASIVLGLGMPTVGVYVLLALMVSPALVEVGVDPMAAHLFVMYFGMMSMITPPVAVAAFAAATIAETDPIKTGFTAIRFAWPAYIVPFLIVYSPTLIMKGDPVAITLDIATAIAGVWIVSMGIIGYCGTVLKVPIRLLFAAIGLALLIPSQAMDHAFIINLVAALVGTILLVLLRRRLKIA